jgi:hypothetical protein
MIIWRCLLRTISLLRPRSLSFPVSLRTCNIALLRQFDLRALENQRRFSLVHRLLESTLVECFADSTGTATVSAKCDETGTTL